MNDNSVGTGPQSINFAETHTLNVSFNVASTDQVISEFFKVELMQ